MTCIICGTPGSYLCSIQGLAVGTCDEHMDAVSCDQALRMLSS